MEVSIIIPTYQRPGKLSACLSALAHQTADPSSYEVLVGVDGPDEATEPAARRAWGACTAPLIVEQCPRSGLNAVRNVLLLRASGKFLLSLNDDVVPCATFVQTHLREQIAAIERKCPAIISGYSPWKRWERPTMFDRVVAESSMIFFYDQMLPEKVSAAGPLHDWGFRHCFGLNFSVPLAPVREAGGFLAFPLAYGYDDIEIAYRLNRRCGMPVLYRPEAIAEHDHRYTAPEVLAREFKLGHCAWHFAGREPAFCEAVFGRDIRSKEELEYCRQYMHRERHTAAMVRETYLSLDAMPGEAVSGPAVSDVIRMIYLHHLPLKRWMWRAGLTAASQERPQDAIVWPGER